MNLRVGCNKKIEYTRGLWQKSLYTEKQRMGYGEQRSKKMIGCTINS